MKKALLLVIALALAGCAAEATPPADTVTTKSGVLRGTLSDDLRTFQGIPYAAPPQRWQAPEPAEKWRGVRAATEPGDLCPQEPTPYADTGSTTEDCLFLNVTTPRTGTGKPVIVWVHGDGVVGGGNLFDPAALVRGGDVVAVTINYRLGVFGAFGYPGLDGAGTFGLQDQQAALRWVHDNIAAFGGDPGNVTLMGESYGAQSVSAHLVAPDSRGLFQRAIMQSPMTLVDMPAGALLPDLPGGGWFAWRTVEETEVLGASMASQVGCVDIECLRALPVEKLFPLMRVFQPMAFGGDVLPGAPETAFENPHDVPVLAGTTRDEHRGFVGLFYDLAGTPVTAEQYPRLLQAAFGDHATEVAKRYPLSDSPSVTWADVLTDRMWALRTTELTSTLAADDLWVYEFADREAPVYLPFPDNYPPGAFHAADVPYVFPDEEFTDGATEAQRTLSDRMIRYWTTFARTGSPNTADLPKWPAHTKADGPVLSLGPDAIQLTDYAKEHQLDFWRSITG